MARRRQTYHQHDSASDAWDDVTMYPHINPNLRVESRKRVLLRALRENPRDSRARAILSLILSSQEKDREALIEARLAADGAEPSPLSLQVLARLVQKWNADEAIQLVQAAIALEPQNVMLYGYLASLYINRPGWVFSLPRNLREAVKATDEGLMVDARNCYCLAMRGQALLLQCRFAESIRAFEAVLTIDPNFRRMHLILSILYLCRLRVRSAYLHLRRYVEKV